MSLICVCVCMQSYVESHRTDVHLVILLCLSVVVVLINAVCVALSGTFTYSALT